MLEIWNSRFWVEAAVAEYWSPARCIARVV